PTRLRVVGEVAAGGFPDRAIGKGEAMRIMTGAPMPEGADTVVRVEDSDNASDVVTITAPTPKGISVRQAGEDLRKGETILDAGTVLRPAEIGLLASVGRSKVHVRKRPRVAVFSTGVEIFVRPALLRMQGREHVSRPRTTARLLEPIEKIPSLRFFARGIHDPGAGTVRLTGPQGSGILRSMSLANCLIDLPVGRDRYEA